MSRRFVNLAFSEIANQYALPVKSISGYFISKWFSQNSRHIEEQLVDRLNLSPDSKVLEIGYGRGNGIQAALSRISSGSGIVFGLEKSLYMEDVTRKKFILELREQQNLVLDRVFDLRHLSYPTDFFDAIFHVDVFYFFKQESMPDICRELFRIVRPGGTMLCGMQLSRLRQLEKWGMMTRSQCDPLRYMLPLENAGFTVNMDYVKSAKGEVQVVEAKKSEAEEGHFDPEEQMRLLERDVKRELLRERLIKQGISPTNEDLKLL